MKKAVMSLAIVFACTTLTFSQTTGGLMGTSGLKGLFDPSRLSVNHSLSFGMSGAPGTDLKSQSLYTTMLQYEFSQPITFNLNFSLPIHSSYNDGMNLNEENIYSAEYFRHIPFDAHLTWKPTENMFLQLSIVKGAESEYLGQRGYLLDPTATENPFMRRW
ncbi:MAG: hypothetical protein ACOC4C_02135 [Fibrobacterota bacterium]